MISVYVWSVLHSMYRMYVNRNTIMMRFKNIVVIHSVLYACVYGLVCVSGYVYMGVYAPFAISIVVIHVLYVFIVVYVHAITVRDNRAVHSDINSMNDISTFVSTLDIRKQDGKPNGGLHIKKDKVPIVFRKHTV